VPFSVFCAFCKVKKWAVILLPITFVKDVFILIMDVWNNYFELWLSNEIRVFKFERILY